jgi:DNA-binding protein YbaB
MASSRDDPQPSRRSTRSGPDLSASIERSQAWHDRARAAAAASAQAALVEGADPRGAVAVRIDERWRVVAVRLRNTWRDVLDPSDLGAAVVAAVADAVEERLRPVVEVLVDVDGLPDAEIVAALAADDGDDVADDLARLPRLPGLRPLGTAALSVDDVEAQLAEIDRQLARQAAAAPAPTVVGRSRRHEVEIELGLVGLPVRVHCRPDWVRVTSVDRLTSALAEAFVEAYAAADDDAATTALDGAA